MKRNFRFWVSLFTIHLLPLAALAAVKPSASTRVDQAAAQSKVASDDWDSEAGSDAGDYDAAPRAEAPADLQELLGVKGNLDPKDSQIFRLTADVPIFNRCLYPAGDKAPALRIINTNDEATARDPIRSLIYAGRDKRIGFRLVADESFARCQDEALSSTTCASDPAGCTDLSSLQGAAFNMSAYRGEQEVCLFRVKDTDGISEKDIILERSQPGTIIECTVLGKHKDRSILKAEERAELIARAKQKINECDPSGVAILSSAGGFTDRELKEIEKGIYEGLCLNSLEKANKAKASEALDVAELIVSSCKDYEDGADDVALVLADLAMSVGNPNEEDEPDFKLARKIIDEAEKLPLSKSMERTLKYRRLTIVALSCEQIADQGIFVRSSSQLGLRRSNTVVKQNVDLYKCENNLKGEALKIAKSCGKKCDDQEIHALMSDVAALTGGELKRRALEASCNSIMEELAYSNTTTSQGLDPFTMQFLNSCRQSGQVHNPFNSSPFQMPGAGMPPQFGSLDPNFYAGGSNAFQGGVPLNFGGPTQGLTPLGYSPQGNFQFQPDGAIYPNYSGYPNYLGAPTGPAAWTGYRY